MAMTLSLAPATMRRRHLPRLAAWDPVMAQNPSDAFGGWVGDGRQRSYQLQSQPNTGLWIQQYMILPQNVE